MFERKEVIESRKNALLKIKDMLSAENVESQFDGKSGDYYSSDKFIVTWIGNWNGIPSEFSIDKTDSLFSSFGNKAIKVTRSLVHEKQLKAYSSIERALIEVGLELSPKAEKKDFFLKYAVSYNERLKINSHE